MPRLSQRIESLAHDVTTTSYAKFCPIAHTTGDDPFQGGSRCSADVQPDSNHAQVRDDVSLLIPEACEPAIMPSQTARHASSATAEYNVRRHQNETSDSLLLSLPSQRW